MSTNIFQSGAVAQNPQKHCITKPGPHYETQLPNGYNKVHKIQRQYNTFDQGDNGYGYKNKQKILITSTVQKESIWSLETGVGTIVHRNSQIHPQEVETPNGVGKNGG